jgi:hypothetical protein
MALWARGGVVVRKRLVLIGGCVLLAAGLAAAIPAISAAQSGKLVVIVEENESYGNIVGNTAQAPYLNQLINQGELFTNYTGVADGSNPNYLGMTSGLTSAKSPPSPNIFQAIDGTGGALTWKEFMESEPANCGNGNSPNIPGTSVPLYSSDHDPAFAYQANTTCSANDVPLNSSTFNPANLPSFSYIVPNQCDEMHTFPGGGQACPAYFGSNPGSNVITMGDNWLAHVVPQLLAQPGVTVLITWDEDLNPTTPPMHIAAIEAGAGVTPGSTDGTAYTHYSLEAGLYKYFGLGTAPNNGATATPLPFGGGPGPSPSPSTTSPTPTTTSPSSSPTGTCSIAADPSSPAVAHSGYGVSSISTASFSPPAGSLLEVMADALHSGVTVTLSDSTGGTYTAGPHIQGTTQAGSIYFFQRYLPSAPGPMTVTATQSGSAKATISLAVQVLDNAAPVQTGAASAATTGSGTSQSGSLTTTQAGSWAFTDMGNGDATDAVTPLPTTANVDVWNDSSQSGNLAVMGRSASPTGTPGATNFGWTANHSDNFVWAGQEVLPASC